MALQNKSYPISSHQSTFGQDASAVTHLKNLSEEMELLREPNQYDSSHRAGQTSGVANKHT